MPLSASAKPRKFSAYGACLRNHQLLSTYRWYGVPYWIANLRLKYAQVTSKKAGFTELVVVALPVGNSLPFGDHHPSMLVGEYVCVLIICLGDAVASIYLRHPPLSIHSESINLCSSTSLVTRPGFSFKVPRSLSTIIVYPLFTRLPGHN